MVEIAERTYQPTEQGKYVGTIIVFQNPRYIIDAVRGEVWQRPADIPYRQPEDVIRLLRSLRRNSSAPRKIINNTDKIIAKGPGPFYSNGGIAGKSRLFALQTAQSLCEHEKARVKMSYQRGEMGDREFRSRYRTMEKIWFSVIPETNFDKYNLILRARKKERPGKSQNLPTRKTLWEA